MDFFYHKKSMRIAMILLGSIGLIMSGYIIYVGQSSILDYFIIATGIYAFGEAFLKKVNIGSRGVSYSFLNKKYFIKWDDVKYIKLVDLGSRKRKSNALCFSKKPVDISTINPKNIGNDLIIILNTEEGAIDEVKKYWKGTISEL